MRKACPRLKLYFTHRAKHLVLTPTLLFFIGDLVPYIMMPRDSKLVESKDFELYKKQRQEEEAEAEKQSR